MGGSGRAAVVETGTGCRSYIRDVFLLLHRRAHPPHCTTAPLFSGCFLYSDVYVRQCAGEKFPGARDNMTV